MYIDELYHKIYLKSMCKEIRNSAHAKCQLTFLPPANEVCEGYVFAPVYLSVSHSGRYTPLDRYNLLGRYNPRQVHPHPWQVHPSWAGTPPAGTPPWAGTPPGQVHPLRRYTPLGRYTPWAGTPPMSTACWEIRATRGGTHPTGMHSCWLYGFM